MKIITEETAPASGAAAAPRKYPGSTIMSIMSYEGKCGLLALSIPPRQQHRLEDRPRALNSRAPVPT